ncbi:Cupredoxin-like domain-containing protein [Methylocella tundrae]|uniref:Cupredoxin-like domain-containing protein n=1 Tax=Methylocella tundrae TaxID=227605 RepID=A0A8B6M7C2_METTU|nr:Cupredoxin-like domain-containing protein [Methylocella tundrae]VTZ50736.1 Cupredoxin-like domain-containing protein [Methylocella tundrae]
MKPSASRRSTMSAGALAICFLAAGWTAAVRAEDAATVRLSLKDHRFQPAEAHAPAGKPITIEIKNLDATPAEFESKTLRVEKVVAGGGVITLQIRPLAPGRYRFFDDYHEDTTEGFLVVQ